MIVIEVQKAAKKIGITTAYQFQKISGFAPAMAARIFKSEWKRIDVSTMNTICNALQCTPNEVLKFTPDPVEEI